MERAVLQGGVIPVTELDQELDNQLERAVPGTAYTVPSKSRVP